MTRSTAARAGPSQTQSQTQRPTQTQKTRGNRQVAQPRSSEEEPDNDDDEDDHDMQGEGNDVLSQKVNDLVRLAVFTEYKRGPLRREDINKKVIGQRTRDSNLIFSMAQDKLRSAFGMELVELPSRAGMEQDVLSGTQAQTQDPTLATGVKKRATASGSKTYMLRSCLDPLIIEHGAQTHAKVLEEEAGDQALFFPSVLDDEEEEDGRHADAERPPKFYGSLISWSRGDQLGCIGILYVILALVLTNGRVMSDGDLRRYLKNLRLPSNPGVKPVRFNTSSIIRSTNLDTYLSGLLKQGYLDRHQVGDATRKGKKGAAGSKRLRTQAEDLEEGRAYEWRWGPRAHCEVGEENIGQFVAEFMVEREANEVDGNNSQGRGAAARKRREENLQKMYGGIEKAAGGKLAELKG